MNRLFKTKDAHLAALLRYELGSQVGIIFDADGTAWFEFDRHAQCVSILKAFYADGTDADFVQGYLVQDARRLLIETAAVRRELGRARDRWRSGQKESLQ